MQSVEQAIRKAHRKVITQTDTHSVGEALRRIAVEEGLGVAILVAWQHGLKIKHIPLENEADTTDAPEVQTISASDDCPYVFVHVPVRRIRGDKSKLVERGIMNRDADPAWFIYHEDGLIGTFSFQNPDSVKLSEEDLEEILERLADAGVLVPANINNRQIQFKDLAARRRIERWEKPVYVRPDNESLDRNEVRAALHPISVHRPEAWAFVREALKEKTACNYCSVQALCPREVTIHSAHVSTHGRSPDDGLATVRNYQLGFTFAPFGDPRNVCHFLAWDFPHINDLVMNMEPQAYSFSDLIRLVRVINDDIQRFCDARKDVRPPLEPVSGVCNHWAGNSIYHQHYQFFRIGGLPLLLHARTAAQRLVEYEDIEVRRVLWPAPAYVVTSSLHGRDDDVMAVAERVAREWLVLSDGEDRSYGNGISIKNHTQNIFVTIEADNPVAVFIPRERRERKTIVDPISKLQKANAGVLEMMGYFVIDDVGAFAAIENMSAADRRRLGDSWLSELAPDTDKIQEFEDNVRICLTEVVTPLEKRISEIPGAATDGWMQEARHVAAAVQHEELDPQQREHLYRELLWAVLDRSYGAER